MWDKGAEGSWVHPQRNEGMKMGGSMASVRWSPETRVFNWLAPDPYTTPGPGLELYPSQAGTEPDTSVNGRDARTE